ncbi:MAG: TldD/PmbA family protein [Bacillota bacterium]
MINTLKTYLNSRADLSGWRIKYTTTKSQELFFIGRSIDMSRCKDVEHLKLTVYKDFEENGARYRGLSTLEIHPSFNEIEIEKAVDASLLAASLSKNEYFPLVKPKDIVAESAKSSFDQGALEEHITAIAAAVFQADKYQNGKLNSFEIFLDKNNTRILNSEGVDVDYTDYHGRVEFVVTWKDDSEEVELSKDLHFSDFDPEYLKNKVDDLMVRAKYKAQAQKTPEIGSGTVILSDEAAKELLKYYCVQAEASAVYNKTSVFKLGERIQGDAVKGDLINIALKRYIKGSTKSVPYDEDGLPLHDINLYEDGILKRYWGSSRYCHYIGVEPTGNINNIEVQGGSKSIAELKKDPYLEILAFSAFNVNNLTGDFAGEIRFGWYHDGNTTIPVTGGSISGNILKSHGNMQLSKEQQQDDGFLGPYSVRLSDISITGA